MADRPPITRHTIAKTALQLIDRSGLDAFSLEKLATELNVKAPSLYHHFGNRIEIFDEVAKLIVLGVRTPSLPEPCGWIDWFVEFLTNYRRSVWRHRNASPLLLQHEPRRFALDAYEKSAEVLEIGGIPTARHALAFEGLDMLRTGATAFIAHSAASAGSAPFPELRENPSRYVRVRKVLDANPIHSEELFQASIRAFLIGVENAAG